MQAPEPLHLTTQSVRWFPQIAQYDCAIFVPRLKLELAGGGSAPATCPTRANIAMSTKTIRIIYLITNFKNESIEVFAFDCTIRLACHTSSKSQLQPDQSPPLLLSG